MKNISRINSPGLRFGLRGALLSLALLTVAGLAMPTTAAARDNDEGGFRRGQDWGEHENNARRWNQERRYYPRGGYYYEEPYYEPPVVYGPPPVVYGPQPGLSFIFPLDIR